MFQDTYSAINISGFGEFYTHTFLYYPSLCSLYKLHGACTQRASGTQTVSMVFFCHLQAMFPDGRIEEFIEAQSVSAELMATPEVAVSIAAAMAHFHFSMLKHFTMLDHLPSCMSPVAQIWDRLRDWTRITNELYKPEELEQYNLQRCRDEVSCLVVPSSLGG